MQIIEKKLSELKPYENNPRINDNAVDYVAASIKEFSFRVPIVLDKDGVIVAGHTRWKAAKKLKLKTVPCIIADDLTPEQIKAFRLADNKVGEIAGWDIEKLDLELEEIDLDMTQFGFLDDMPDAGELNAEKEDSEKIVVHITFDTYAEYKAHEEQVKEFADSVGAKYTIGK